MTALARGLEMRFCASFWTQFFFSYIDYTEQVARLPYAQRAQMANMAAFRAIAEGRLSSTGEATANCGEHVAAATDRDTGDEAGSGEVEHRAGGVLRPPGGRRHGCHRRAHCRSGCEASICAVSVRSATQFAVTPVPRPRSPAPA
jgi:hypothetical protein